MKKTVLCSFIILFLNNSFAFSLSLDEAIESSLRTSEYQNRDQYRNPKETLKFFAIKDSMTVVELWPATGWYSEILVPFLEKNGKYIGATFDPNFAPWASGAIKRSKDRWESSKALAGTWDSKVVSLSMGFTPITDRESVDMVLTFRNLHNWLKAEILMDVFNKSFYVLKPGGIFGVVEHRALPNTSIEDMNTSGYVTEKLAIEYAQKAGFVLIDKSEINANPKDTKIYPKGVWTLPPTLRLGEEDRQKYIEIGESDRMTLLFKKP